MQDSLKITTTEQNTLTKSMRSCSRPMPFAMTTQVDRNEQYRASTTRL